MADQENDHTQRRVEQIKTFNAAVAERHRILAQISEAIQSATSLQQIMEQSEKLVAEHKQTIELSTSFQSVEIEQIANVILELLTQSTRLSSLLNERLAEILRSRR